ncbi:hypothetical protein QBC41DRAFT_278021 [Cercophora samala]|uniref:N-acetyltransferase domain-containing protein n=1 Tax=Cercophora samala TaxID=330535 RepID=A0AA39ZCD0_9PEZI|nr:hypothetical protein QBC41DRAFT_278021 [Cercophora samala]
MPESILSHNGFALREATEADLPALTRIHVQGFTEEPYEQYCFPRRNEYPDDYWQWTKQSYKDFLDQPHKYTIYLLEDVKHDPGLDQRRDVNVVHFEAFSEAAGQRFHTYFAEWADKQVNLSSLVVHPDFRRRGGGTMLVRWGMDRAQAKAWPVTLCASPMGRFLYEYLEFRTIATEVV